MDLIQIGKSVLSSCMDVKAGESVLVITDDKKLPIGNALYQAAKELGVKISCDLNYRNKLWSKEKAGQVMGGLCQYVDVCIANEEDAADVFGEVNREGYKDVARQLAERFGFEKVAITLRESISANDNNWSAMLYDGGDYYFSKKYKMHIVDRVGGGDSFGGGVWASSGDRIRGGGFLPEAFGRRGL